MKFSAKFTTVSFLAALATSAAALAFGGCTVTSGTVDTDGGPSVTPADGGGDADASPAATCEGNKQPGTLVSADCQNCLNAQCCNELKGCFNATVTPGDAGGTDDCNAYSECISSCITKTTQAEQDQCYTDCEFLAGDGIPAAYNAIIDCAQQNGCETACQLQAPPDVDAGDDAGDASDQ